MVALGYLWKALVTSTVVVSVVARPVSDSALPSLLDATVSELASGLEKGSFTSVDLVNVRTLRLFGLDSYLRSMTAC